MSHSLIQLSQSLQARLYQLGRYASNRLSKVAHHEEEANIAGRSEQPEPLGGAQTAAVTQRLASVSQTVGLHTRLRPGEMQTFKSHIRQRMNWEVEPQLDNHVVHEEPNIAGLQDRELTEWLDKSQQETPHWWFCQCGHVLHAALLQCTHERPPREHGRRIGCTSNASLWPLTQVPGSRTRDKEGKTDGRPTKDGMPMMGGSRATHTRHLAAGRQGWSSSGFRLTAWQLLVAFGTETCLGVSEPQEPWTLQR